MTVSDAIFKLQAMNTTGTLLVEDRDGRWTFVQAVETAAVPGREMHPPTTLLIRGVRYVREDAIQQQGAA